MSTLRAGNSTTTAVVVTGDTSGALYLKADNGEINAVATTGAIYLPSGTIAQRPSSPAAGGLRYNSNSSVVEAYTAGAWNAVSGGTIDGVFMQNINTITANFTSVSGTNYLSAGKITQTSGVVTINSGSAWQVI
jgi:hypothetical protein